MVASTSERRQCSSGKGSRWSDGAEKTYGTRFDRCTDRALGAVFTQDVCSTALQHCSWISNGEIETRRTATESSLIRLCEDLQFFLLVAWGRTQKHGAMIDANVSVFLQEPKIMPARFRFSDAIHIVKWLLLCDDRR